MNAYELARKMKVSHTTIYTWVREGLPYKEERSGLRIRMVFDLIEVKEWAKNRRDK